MKTTYQLSINRNSHRRNWSVSIVSQREGCPETTTNMGKPTLACALWSSIGDIMTTSGTARLAEITVNDEPMQHKEALQLIERNLKGGGGEYKIKNYREFLTAQNLGQESLKREGL